MRAQEAVTFSNIAATTAAFELRGGRYDLLVIGATFGTVDLQMQGPDGTTFISVLPAAFAATGIKQQLDLPPGQYKVVIAGATGVYAVVARVPLDE